MQYACSISGKGRSPLCYLRLTEGNMRSSIADKKQQAESFEGLSGSQVSFRYTVYHFPETNQHDETTRNNFLNPPYTTYNG